ncbi:hypothetical protein [Actinomycetospora termitidis]|uniref:Uncharacterized protein n=1 Tax=Actinomycetospora termitidis TaxID=3053470 RepID=A0ABT7MEE1_9PSEU|nr:hypothetical protein [Actinomycetospora sp. Odt1-22]MDL5157738.1 hypothetical protein [Actinomycetospora sp. Odt1-22]
MSDDSWLPPPPFGVDDHHHDDHHHDDRHRHERRYDHRERGMELRDRVRSQYGTAVSVGDILSFLDYRVNELYAAVLEPERHGSRVPGSPVRLSGLDAMLNADAAAFRGLTELGERLDRVESKLDQLLERLPKPTATS